VRAGVARMPRFSEPARAVFPFLASIPFGLDPNAGAAAGLASSFCTLEQQGLVRHPENVSILVLALTIQSSGRTNGEANRILDIMGLLDYPLVKASRWSLK
jgi:hypothetical protein